MAAQARMRNGAGDPNDHAPGCSASVPLSRFAPGPSTAARRPAAEGRVRRSAVPYSARFLGPYAALIPGAAPGRIAISKGAGVNRSCFDRVAIALAAGLVLTDGAQAGD